MAFNFPSSPTVGQVSNGYVWNGQAWTGNGNLAALAPPSDTAPSSPVNGQLWWESDTGILWLWYVDANTSQWVQIGGSGIGDAPNDGVPYARNAGFWTPATPSPITGVGPGQLVPIVSAAGSGYVLPASGEWAYWAHTFASPANTYSGNVTTGRANGGTAVLAAIAGHLWVGFAWRVR